MIQIAICDDEENSRGYLKQLLIKQREFIEDCNNSEYEIQEFSSGQEVLNYKKEMDILFLDVDLKEEVSGMEVAKILRNRSTEHQPIIIFISGHKEYVFDAFDVDALHYLLKPIDDEKFAKVFAKALSQLYTKTRNYV